MRFVCFGFLDPTEWAALSDQERAAFSGECMAFDAELRRAGHLTGGVALAGSPHAVTLHRRSRELSVTDGPFAETREVLGGYILMLADSRDAALRFAAGHPGAPVGAVEVRPLFDVSALRHRV